MTADISIHGSVKVHNFLRVHHIAAMNLSDPYIDFCYCTVHLSGYRSHHSILESFYISDHFLSVRKSGIELAWRECNTAQFDS